MKLTSFYSAISAVICLFCLAGTVRGADLSPNTPDIERNKISAVAINVSLLPVPDSLLAGSLR